MQIFSPSLKEQFPIQFPKPLLHPQNQKRPYPPQKNQSLMSIDAQILNTNKLKFSYVEKKLHSDQVWFIPRMHSWFSTQKSISKIENINRPKRHFTKFNDYS